MTNLDISYKMSAVKDLGNGNAKVNFNVGNLLNRQGDYASLNSDINSNPLFFVIPTCSYQVSMSVPL